MTTMLPVANPDDPVGVRAFVDDCIHRCAHDQSVSVRGTTQTCIDLALTYVSQDLALSPSAHGVMMAESYVKLLGCLGVHDSLLGRRLCTDMDTGDRSSCMDRVLATSRVAIARLQPDVPGGVSRRLALRKYLAESLRGDATASLTNTRCNGGTTSCLDAAMRDEVLAPAVALVLGDVGSAVSMPAIQDALRADCGGTSCLDRLIDIAQTPTDYYSESVAARPTPLSQAFVKLINRPRGDTIAPLLAEPICTDPGTGEPVTGYHRLIAPIAERDVNRATHVALLDAARVTGRLDPVFLANPTSCRALSGQLTSCVDRLLDIMQSTRPGDETNRPKQKRYEAARNMLSVIFNVSDAVDALYDPNGCLYPTFDPALQHVDRRRVSCASKVLDHPEASLHARLIRGTERVDPATRTCAVETGGWVGCVDKVLQAIERFGTQDIYQQHASDVVDSVIYLKGPGIATAECSRSDGTVTSCIDVLMSASASSFASVIVNGDFSLQDIPCTIGDVRTNCLDKALATIVDRVMSHQRIPSRELATYTNDIPLALFKSDTIDLTRADCVYRDDAGTAYRASCIQRLLDLVVASEIQYEADGPLFAVLQRANLHDPICSRSDGTRIPCIVHILEQFGEQDLFPRSRRHNLDGFRCAILGNRRFDDLRKTLEDPRWGWDSIPAARIFCSRGPCYLDSYDGDADAGFQDELAMRFSRGKTNWLSICACGDLQRDVPTPEYATCYEANCLDHVAHITRYRHPEFYRRYVRGVAERPFAVDALNTGFPEEYHRTDDISGVYAVDFKLHPKDRVVKRYVLEILLAMQELQNRVTRTPVSIEVARISTIRPEDIQLTQEFTHDEIAGIYEYTETVSAYPRVNLVAQDAEGVATVITPEMVAPLAEYIRSLRGTASESRAMEYFLSRDFSTLPAIFREICTRIVDSPTRAFSLRVEYVDANGVPVVGHRFAQDKTRRIHLSKAEIRRIREGGGRQPGYYRIVEDRKANDISLGSLANSRVPIPTTVRKKLAAPSKPGDRDKPLWMVITQDPRDIMRASTCQHWGSCVKLEGHDGGMFHEALLTHMDAGSWIAYLVEPDQLASPTWRGRLFIHQTMSPDRVVVADRRHDGEFIYGLPEYSNLLPDAVAKVLFDRGYNRTDTPPRVANRNLVIDEIRLAHRSRDERWIRHIPELARMLDRGVSPHRVWSEGRALGLIPEFYSDYVDVRIARLISPEDMQAVLAYRGENFVTRLGDYVRPYPLRDRTPFVASAADLAEPREYLDRDDRGAAYRENLYGDDDDYDGGYDDDNDDDNDNYDDGDD